MKKSNILAKLLVVLVLILEPTIGLTKSCENVFGYRTPGFQNVSDQGGSPLVRASQMFGQIPAVSMPGHKVESVMQKISSHRMILFSGFHFEALSLGIMKSGIYHDVMYETYGYHAFLGTGVSSLLWGMVGAEEAIANMEDLRERLKSMDPATMNKLAEETWSALVLKFKEINDSDSKEALSDFMFSFEGFDQNEFIAARKAVLEIDQDPQMRRLAIEVIIYTMPEMVKRSIAAGKYIKDIRSSVIPKVHLKNGAIAAVLSLVLTTGGFSYFGLTAVEVSTTFTYLYSMFIGGMGGLFLSKYKERGIGRLVHQFYRRRALRRARKFGKQKLAIGHYHHSSQVITVQQYLENLGDQVKGQTLDTDTRELIDSLGKALSEVTGLISSIFKTSSQLPELVKQLRKEKDSIRRSSLILDISSAIQLEANHISEASTNLQQVKLNVEELRELTLAKIESLGEADEGLQVVLSTTLQSLEEILGSISSYQVLVEKSQELHGIVTTPENIQRAENESEFLSAVEEYIELLHPDQSRWRR